MALEIEFADLTGFTDYVNVVNSVGEWWNGSTFETFAAGNWTTYDIAATEFGASGVYAATFPVIAAGVYNVMARRQAGGSPAITDTVIATGKVEWSGTAILPLSSVKADTAQIAADLPVRITKNTALAGFPFYMVDSTDHVSGKTGLTVTATRSLDGAAFAACANAVSEMSNGWYKIDLAAGDTNGNTIAFKFTASGADATNFTVVTAPT